MSSSEVKDKGATEIKSIVADKINVVLIGDGGVGKTAYCKRWTDGSFSSKYEPSTSVQEYKFEQHFGETKQNHRIVEFTLRDTCGQEKFGVLRDACYKDADAIIIMFDVTARVTYNNVPTWYKDVERVCPKAIVVLVGNKDDVKDRKVKPRDIVFHRKKSLNYYDISVKNNHNVEKPLSYIARRHFKDSNLRLVKCCCRLMEQQQEQALESRKNLVNEPDAVILATQDNDDDF